MAQRDAVDPRPVLLLCPGQGAQAVGMGRAWRETSAAAAEVFAEADDLLGDRLGDPPSRLCFEGPRDRLERTDVSQVVIFTCSTACHAALVERGEWGTPVAAAGLSLGEYTALHLTGAMDFATGLELVASRGALMQAAADASEGGMVALIGADEARAQALCEQVLGEPAHAGEILVPANCNAPGQVVLAGSTPACHRVAEAAEAAGLRARHLAVAGAFHTPLMAPAAEAMRAALEAAQLHPPGIEVWSNVTADLHDPGDVELLRRRLVEQITRPVRWESLCRGMLDRYDQPVGHEMAPGSVLRGLMRRIDRNAEVRSHDQP